jgi:hypothetical protein
MESQIQLKAIRKLAVAGEQAGFTLDQMIQLLNSGMSVVTLLDLIAWRLGPSRSSFESSYRVGSRAISHSREVAQ